ncbi:HrgC protein [uncultured Fusobacterium sp.]|uniref:HrgC protein n=1 Tax=uncultured Fusobacterium sp. TaxID=159267 RepID=UPI0027DB03F7|nr:HrgC protein [uncultured Fusobacterium sp.]
MSVRINLEKDGKKESGFMGFSWTLLFWGFWVPLFRGRKKDFVLFFLFFLVKIGLIVQASNESLKVPRTIEILDSYKPSYISLIPTLLFVIVQGIETWLSYYYNRHCTNSLLENGYYPPENDEYSVALLKNYSYVPYTKEELEDKSIREKYKKHSDVARKEEEDKFKTFFIISFIIFVILMIIGRFEFSVIWK